MKTTILINEKQAARADQLIDPICKDPAYVSIEIQRSIVLRMAIDQGLELLEQAYGIELPEVK